MEILYLVLILLSTVLISAVIHQLFPKIALPLVQAGIGLIAAIFMPRLSTLVLDPDLFLVVFIAPLLFLEAKNADLKMLVREIKPIVSLAIVLVLVSMLILGFLLNLLVPAIAIAAAVALGAALGPTDAVAVSSLSKIIKLPKWEHGIMEGEMLFNDASGIVGFQVAIIVATTGAFSMQEAIGDFALEFFGGLLVGLLFGFVLRWISNKIVEIGVENITFFILYELFCPFVIYLASTAIGVSGIIAVVVAGLFKIVDTYKFGENRARLINATNSIWDVLSFTLNGIVFVLLGTQLPQIVRGSWGILNFGPLHLVGVILALTFAMFFVRFLWLLGMEYFHFRKVDKDTLPKDERGLSLPRRALIASLSGAKGAVTLSIMFTLPIAFANRELLILIASGVVIVSLLVSILAVPLVALKKEKVEKSPEDIEVNRQTVSILRHAMGEIIRRYHESDRPISAEALSTTIKGVSKHAKSLNGEDDGDFEKGTMRFLEALEWEASYYMGMQDEAKAGKPISPEAAALVSESIDQRRKVFMNMLPSDRKKTVRDQSAAMKSAIKLKRKAKKTQIDEQAEKEAHQILKEGAEHVIGRLSSIEGDQTEYELVLTCYQLFSDRLSNPQQKVKNDEEEGSWDVLADWGLNAIIDETERRVGEGALTKHQGHIIKRDLSMLISEMVE